MRESVAREFIEMSTAYAKDTAHVRKQFETSADQSQHLTTFAQKDIPTPGVFLPCSGPSAPRVSSKNSKANRIETGERCGGIRRFVRWKSKKNSEENS